MPCMDYDRRWEDTWDRAQQDSAHLKDIKKHSNKLARIACKALTALEAMGKEDFLLLQDDEVREWWQAHKEADRKAKDAKIEKERRAQMKADALAKLSDEEKVVLGLKKK